MKNIKINDDDLINLYQIISKIKNIGELTKNEILSLNKLKTLYEKYEEREKYKSIDEFIEDNYIIKGNISINDDNIINVKGNIFVKNKNINKFLPVNYKFGIVTGDFDCSECKSLESLEGAPRRVEGNFICNGCTLLTNLKGSPKYVAGNFECVGCDINLRYAEGYPSSFYIGMPAMIKGKFIDDYYKYEKIYNKYWEFHR